MSSRMIKRSGSPQSRSRESGHKTINSISGRSIGCGRCCCILILVVLIIVTPQPAAAAAAGCGMSRHLPSRYILVLRGGELTDEDRELDAFIEQLLASVDDTDSDSAHAIDPVELFINTKSDDVPKSKKKRKKPAPQIQTEDSRKYSVSQSALDSTTISNPVDGNEDAETKATISDDDLGGGLALDSLPPVKKEEEHKPDIQRKEETSDKDEPKGNSKEVDLLGTSNESKSSTGRSKSKGTRNRNKSKRTSSKDEPKEESVVDKEVSSIETVPSDNQQQLVKKRRPPNAVYRFFLRQGIIGQVFVVAMILLMEWIDTYIPPLAHLLAWFGARIFPAPNERMYTERPAAAVTRPSISSRRTGQTRRQQKKLTEQADKAALKQLKRVGNLQEAKYRYVSRDFLSRHGLGPFANESRAELLDAPEEEDVIQKKQLSVVSAQKEDEEDDIGWIEKALRKDKPSTAKDGSLVKPTVSVGVGSDGVSVGFEFSIGGGNKRRKSSESVKRKKAKKVSPRSSDRDGGDGIFGRIRAAAGANSLVSRSLLGAYPGDAIPPNEAANANGLAEFARKYGWGDWSDDEEEEYGVARGHLQQPKKKRKRTKHRRNSQQSSNIGIEFNFPSGHGPSQLGPRIKRTSRPAAGKVNLEAVTSDTSKSGHERPSPVNARPRVDGEFTPHKAPLERIVEVRRKKKKRKPSTDDPSF